MDTATLVDRQIEDGKKLITHLEHAGFAVDLALWILGSAEESWFLYIASPVVARNGLAAAYQKVYAELPACGAPSISRSEIKLIKSDHPIAEESRIYRDASQLSRFSGRKLGNMIVEDAWIYPER